MQVISHSTCPYLIAAHFSSGLTLQPGDVVSVDQLVSSTPGLVACLHHASAFSYIFHHTALNSIQNVHAKQAFKTEARRYGIMIKHYHADNGLFHTKQFLQDL